MIQIIFLLLPFCTCGQQKDWYSIAKETVADESAELEIREISADRNGDVVVMGLYYGQPTFAGKQLPDFKGNINSRNSFISKINGNTGKLIWFHSNLDAELNSAKIVFHQIQLDGWGNIHILAEIQNSLIFHDTVICISDTNSTSAIVKYSNDGTNLSIKKLFENQWGINANNSKHFFTLDKQGNYYYGTQTLGNVWREGFTYEKKNGIYADLLLAKFSANANLIWSYNNYYNLRAYLQYPKLVYNNINSLYINFTDIESEYNILIEIDTSGKAVLHKQYGNPSLKVYDMMCNAAGRLFIAGAYGFRTPDSVIFIWSMPADFNGGEIVRYTKGAITDIYIDTVTNQLLVAGNCDSTLDIGLPNTKSNNNGKFMAGFDYSLKPFMLKNGFIEGHLSSKSLVTQTACGNPFFATSFREKNITFDDLKIDGRGINANLNHKGVSSLIVKYASDTTMFLTYKDSTLPCDSSISLVSKHLLDYKNIYWQLDDEIIDSNKKELIYTFEKSGRYEIKLLGIKENGCSDAYSDSVTFIKKPIAKFTRKDTVGCQWLGYQFTNQSVADTINTTIGESYLWDFGDGTTDTAKNPLHIFTKSGSFKVSLIYSNGFCSDTFTQEQTIEILAAPKPGFAINDSVGCAPFTVNVKDNSAGAVAKYTYSFGKENESNEASPTYTFNKPGIYYITQKLLGTTGCITSDSVRIRIRAGIEPDEKQEMFRATFVNNATVEISWRKHPLAQYYTLYRQTGNNAPQAIQKHFSDTVYMDQAVALDKPSRYYIQATDSCGNLSAQSSIAQPVILHGENKDNTIFLLTYTSYEKWQNGVQKYVLQYQAAEDSFTNIANAASLIQTDSFRAQSPNGTQCYRIMALEMDGNKQFSYSNTVCLPHIPQVYVPNAFSPNNDAVNDFFSISAIGITESNINIYNRWGEKIYQNQQGEAINWDGSFKTATAPDDVYIYTLQLRTIHGKTIYKTGDIYLTR